MRSSVTEGVVWGHQSQKAWCGVISHRLCGVGSSATEVLVWGHQSQKVRCGVISHRRQSQKAQQKVGSSVTEGAMWGQQSHKVRCGVSSHRRCGVTSSGNPVQATFRLILNTNKKTQDIVLTIFKYVSIHCVYDWNDLATYRVRDLDSIVRCISSHTPC